MARRAIIALVLFCLGVLPAAAQSEKKEPPQHKKEAAAVKKSEAAPTDDPIVARVNGAPVYRSDLLALRATLPPQLQQQPADQLMPRLLDQYVAMTLVAQSARKARLNDDPRVKKMTTIAEDQILQDAYFDSIMKKEITQPKLKASYEQYLKTAPSREEVHARHILVPTEEQAKDIIDQLKKGADFAKLASDKTTDPAGKASGGDLGYFTEADMVPDFAKAAFALKKGEFSQTPVKTQFGWHVIKVEDRREGKPLTYEQVAPQLARQMAQELYNARVKELAAASKIEVYNGDGGRPVAVAPQRPQAAPAAAAAAPPPGEAAAPPPLPDQPALLPLDNGTPAAPADINGPPTLAPGTAPENMGK